jgi:Ser/Thr protein kinase RdoA (MazF antagonist)
MTEVALRAAVAQHGLRCDDPVVLRDASNLLVHLRPAPVVARVMTVTATVRDGDATLVREVAIASHLAAAGAPVVAPSAELDPGPHQHDGQVLSFWTYVDEAGRARDAPEAGRRLARCHELLEGFDGADLVELGGLAEVDAMLERLAAEGAVGEHDARLLRAAGTDVRRRIARAGQPLQAIHGDAHLNNVINGPDGPLWNDWEDTFLGPRAWDLGCMLAHARAFGRDAGPVLAALGGYGDAFDDDTLDVCVAARRFQITIWFAVMARLQPQFAEHARALIAFYRERA